MSSIPLVTIVTIFSNRSDPIQDKSKYMARYFEGLSSQIDKNFDLIIIDNFLDDWTRLELEKYIHRHENITLYRTDKKHYSGFLRLKYAHTAKTPYVTFHDDDDFIDKLAIKEINKFLHSNPSTDIIVPNTCYVNSSSWTTANLWQAQDFVEQSPLKKNFDFAFKNHILTLRVIKTSILQKLPKESCMDIFAFEDLDIQINLFNLQFVDQKIFEIHFLPTAVYYYDNRPSASHRLANYDNIKNNWTTAIALSKKLYSIVKNLELKENFYTVFRANLGFLLYQYNHYHQKMSLGKKLRLVSIIGFQTFRYYKDLLVLSNREPLTQYVRMSAKFILNKKK